MKVLLLYWNSVIRTRSVSKPDISISREPSNTLHDAPLKGREKGGVLRVLLTANDCQQLKKQQLQDTPLTGRCVRSRSLYATQVENWKKNILLLGKTHTLQRVLHQTSLHHTWITNNSKHRVSWCLCNKSTLCKTTTSLPTQRMDVPNCTQYGRSPPSHLTPHTSQRSRLGFARMARMARRARMARMAITNINRFQWWDTTLHRQGSQTCTRPLLTYQIKRLLQ